MERQADLMMRKKKGFTLLELLAVLVILAALSAIVIPIIAGKGDTAKQAAHAANMKMLQNQAQMYMLEHGTVADSADIIDAMVTEGFLKERPKYPVNNLSTYAVEVVADRIVVKLNGPVAPTIVITADKSGVTDVTSITYTFTFSADVDGFDDTDVDVTNGTKGLFTKLSDSTYTLVIDNPGPTITQTVKVLANKVTAEIGEQGNLPSNDYSILVDYSINAPSLVSGMTPLIFDTNDFRAATEQEKTDKSWYRYRTDLDQSAADRVANERWANVKLLDGSMFVWIPRYTYKITPGGTGSIDVKYSNGITDYTADGYKTHPAFWWDNNSDDVHDAGEELTGIWMAKFEASNDGGGKIQVKPGITSWRGKNVNDVFVACRAMQLTNSAIYGISSDSNVIDTHMMKNSEWGVVAYLTEAIRDRDEVGLNNNNGCITGGSDTLSTIYTDPINMEMSSTGNAYGIYDLRGGSYESVASYVGAFYKANGQALQDAPLKYKNAFPALSSSDGQITYTNIAGQTDGWAWHEVMTAGTGNSTFQGYQDVQMLPYNAYPYVVRGEDFAITDSSGIFASNYEQGAGYGLTSFRPVIVDHN